MRAAVAVVASASRAGLERRDSSGEGSNGVADDPTAAAPPTDTGG